LGVKWWGSWTSEVELGLEVGNLCFKVVNFIVGLGSLLSRVVEALGEYLYLFGYWWGIGLHFLEALCGFC
jgi:hypothetical protein